LVAFIVGDLGYVETSTTGYHNNGNPVLIRVYAPKGRENHGEFALSVAAQVLEYFAEGSRKFAIFNNIITGIIIFIIFYFFLVFDIPYPLPKCDMVGIPDFEAGRISSSLLIFLRIDNLPII